MTKLESEQIEKLDPKTRNWIETGAIIYAKAKGDFGGSYSGTEIYGIRKGSWREGAEAMALLRDEREAMLVNALESLADRHKWHPDMGGCICPEHIRAEKCIAEYRKLKGEA